MKIIHIFLMIILPFIFTISLEAFSQEDCEIIRDSCEYYLCRERNHPCGQRGYNLALGHRYCRQFLKRYVHRYSEKGQLWLSDVRYCLQEKLENMPIETSCRKIRSKAMKSHVECYLDTGYCELPLKDKKRILKTVGIRILQPFFLSQGLKVLFRCPK